MRGAAFRRAARRVLRRDRPPDLAGPALIEAFARAYPSAVFVEIGANDGEQHDFLREHIRARDWTGVMVEPVPYVFERLKRNYADVTRVSFANAAVADRDGVLPFYHLAAPAEEERVHLPSWYDGLGSFSRATIEGHARKVPDFASRFREIQVPSIRFDTLMARYGLERLDLLLIDTEGYDLELLRHIDLATHRPRVVIYEHFHLGAESRTEAQHEVKAAGYDVFEEGFDTFCLRPGPSDELDAVWRSLTPGAPGLYVEDEPP
jgi:FkbM family methyltransferase